MATSTAETLLAKILCEKDCQSSTETSPIVHTPYIMIMGNHEI